jgi:predicted dehydrogenase
MEGGAMAPIRLVTLDPGHFHAALIHKEMYPEVSARTAVYGPLGPDLLAHLNRIAQFNARAERPTAWELDVHCSPRYLEEMLAARAGDAVVIAGRNRRKIDYISRSVEAGFHVLADKPWIIRRGDLECLRRVLDQAEAAGLIAYDIMTERYEITSILQRELVGDPDVFGEIVPGAAAEPGVRLASVHHIRKQVAGAPLLRPAWFFDISEQGEALADVGTHLADLVHWTLSPGREIDYRTEIAIRGGERWPTVLSLEQYSEVTGERQFAPFLAPWVDGDRLLYFGNNRLRYTLRGVHVTLEALWNFEAPPGAGDTHFAAYRGTRSRIEVRQGPQEAYRPELYVVPAAPGVEAALARRIETLARRWPGVALEPRPGEYRVVAPEIYRTGHEAHFAEVARQFFRYVQRREPPPPWEKSWMLAKYFVTTHGADAAS